MKKRQFFIYKDCTTTLGKTGPFDVVGHIFRQLATRSNKNAHPTTVTRLPNQNKYHQVPTYGLFSGEPIGISTAHDGNRVTFRASTGINH